MLVARNLPHAGQVCLTEQTCGRALEHLQRNVAANRHLPNMTAVTVCSCDWTHFLDDQLLERMQHSTCESEKQYVAGCHAQQRQEQPQPQQQQAQEGLTTAPAASSVLQLSAAELADMQSLLRTSWDIIIGSDLVYNTAGVKGLPRVLAALMNPKKICRCPAQCELKGSSASDTGTCGNGCSHSAEEGTSSEICSCTCHSPAYTTSMAVQPPALGSCSSSCGTNQIKTSHNNGPVFYYAHTKHRFDAFDVDLFDEMASLGLDVEEVIEAGEELPPPSPPPFSSLYPEMRIAMFRITRNSNRSCVCVCVLSGTAV